jgi:hypothetical protein
LVELSTNTCDVRGAVNGGFVVEEDAIRHGIVESLEAEAVELKEAAEVAAAATRDPSGVIAVGSTLSSVAPSSAASSSQSNSNVAGLRMQLEDANRDAEDLRQ